MKPNGGVVLPSHAGGDGRGPSRRGLPPVTGRVVSSLLPDVGQEAAGRGRFAAHVPLDAELAAGLARGLDEADLEHDLLRLVDADRIDDLGAELAAIITALSSVTPSGAVPVSMMRPLTAVTRMLGVREAALELVLQQRGVVGDLDVEHADQLLAFAIERHARGAELLAEDRQRLVGHRMDVGDVGIADHDVAEAGVEPHVLRLADRDGDGGEPLGRATARPAAAPARRCSTPGNERRGRDGDERRGELPREGGEGAGERAAPSPLPATVGVVLSSCRSP